MYKVIVEFADLQDNKYRYHVGDKFPHDGAGPISEDRIRELSGSGNNLRKPLIEKIADVKSDTKPAAKAKEAAEDVVEEKPVENKPKKGKKK